MKASVRAMLAVTGAVVTTLVAVPAQADEAPGVTMDITSGTVDKSGQITIKGTLTCNQDSHVYFYVDLRQPRHHGATDNRATSSACSIGGTPWSMTFAKSEVMTGAFKPGSMMTVRYDGELWTCADYTDDSCAYYTYGSDTVLLTRAR
jgi:hypothetical protein